MAHHAEYVVYPLELQILSIRQKLSRRKGQLKQRLKIYLNIIFSSTWKPQVKTHSKVQSGNLLLNTNIVIFSQLQRHHSEMLVKYLLHLSIMDPHLQLHCLKSPISQLFGS